MPTFPTVDTPTILLVFFALLLGVLCTYLYFVLRLRHNHLTTKEVEDDFVRRELHDHLQKEADGYFEDLREQREQAARFRTATVRLESELKYVNDKLAAQRAEMERLQAESLAHFERTAERLLDEKSRKFSDQNASQLNGLLQPLKERLAGFEQQAQRRFAEETRDRVSLRQKITNLHALNQRISAEANNLAGALRGSSKTQGDWGEWQLLTLLEASGLREGTHFSSQSSFRDADGRQKRPDFIVNLPEGKQLVIDCKVSLTAYERHCSCAPSQKEEIQKQAQLHVASLRNHVRDLASKNYTRLYQINSPDYLLLFVPIEPAYALAQTTDRKLFLEALERNVVIVTASTLLATLRTVNFIWKQDDQRRNVEEIARQGGLLYDGFVSFTEELEKVGQRLDQAQASYQSAFTKLSKGRKRGATLVGRAERLQQLGVKSKKRLAGRLLEEE